MQQLILKQDLSAVKLKALIQFLKVWDIEVEVKKSKTPLLGAIDEVSLLSESSLSKDWSTLQEDIAWENL